MRWQWNYVMLLRMINYVHNPIKLYHLLSVMVTQKPYPAKCDWELKRILTVSARR